MAALCCRACYGVCDNTCGCHKHVDVITDVDPVNRNIVVQSIPTTASCDHPRMERCLFMDGSWWMVCVGCSVILRVGCTCGDMPKIKQATAGPQNIGLTCPTHPFGFGASL